MPLHWTWKIQDLTIYCYIMGKSLGFSRMDTWGLNERNYTSVQLGRDWQWAPLAQRDQARHSWARLFSHFLLPLPFLSVSFGIENRIFWGSQSVKLKHSLHEHSLPWMEEQSEGFQGNNCKVAEKTRFICKFYAFFDASGMMALGYLSINRFNVPHTGTSQKPKLLCDAM